MVPGSACLFLCGLADNIPCEHLIRGDRLGVCEPAALCSQNKHSKVYGLQSEAEVKKGLVLEGCNFSGRHIIPSQILNMEIRLMLQSVFVGANTSNFY